MSPFKKKLKFKKSFISNSIQKVSLFLKTPSFLCLTILFLIAIFGPLMVGDPLAISKGPRLSAPSWQFFFGTDQYGMDIFSRVVNGARIDLFTGFTASFIAASIGMPLGAFAAYKKGIWDQILLRSSESFQSFPVLILAMGTIAAIGSGMINIIFVIAIVNIPVYIRLTRSSVIPILEKDFIHAARCAGKSDLQILFKHILPNVSPVVISQFSVNCAWAIQILAALSFVGLGVKLPTPEWGAMVRGGADYILYGQWWVSVFPGIAILLTVLILNQVADIVGEKNKF